MYNSYFGFSEKPFTIAPNPRYLFMSPRHQEALAHMLYGMQGDGGVMVLTGEVGTGKTTICRRLLEQVPENTRIAYMINPKLTALELLASICDELHIKYPTPINSIKVLTDLINEHLLKQHGQGLHTVLIIDEAQNLDVSVLEQLRLLTNLETNEKKLLQIMLLGQPELADILQRNELRQLAQRITARYHLTPLNKSEINDYLKHRLAIAGNDNPQLFPPAVVRLLYRYTKGVPRLINLIADRALLGAYSCESKKISLKILTQAMHEVCGQKQTSPNLLWVYMTTLLMLVVGLSIWNIQTVSKTPFVAQTQHEPSNPSSLAVATIQPPKAMLPQVSVTHSNIVADPNTNDTVAEITPTPELHKQALGFIKLPLHQNQDEAFTAIFATWHISYQPKRDGEACIFAKQHQLHCFRQRGDIAQMRSLNRPAVLTVSDKDGQAAYVTITALTGTSATTQAGVVVSLVQLALQSHNDFIILWRTPQNYTGPVRPGHEGKLVQLLAEQCSLAQKQQWIGAPRLKYDVSLKEQIKSFQRSQGLNPDGVAGPITWIHLNSLTHQDWPTLQKPLTTDYQDAVAATLAPQS